MYGFTFTRCIFPRPVGYTTSKTYQDDNDGRNATETQYSIYTD